MTFTSRNLVALAAAALLSLGLAGAASAQQGMPSATDSKLNASWVDGSAEAPASTRSFGYPVTEGFSGDVTARRGASVAAESESDATWVDPSRSPATTAGARAGSFGYPVGDVFDGGAARSGAVTAFKSEDATWVDPFAASRATTLDGR